jgi:uncharacterized protein YcnI
MKRVLGIILTSVCLMLAGSSYALAHVTVEPSEAQVAKFTEFAVSVPVERAVATTSVRLVIPEGLAHVMPNVKPGWNIEVKYVGMKGKILNSGEEAPVAEIIWSGGSIPSGQRDKFEFSAQVPAQEAKVVWKAYQTYADGVVVAWDRDPTTLKEHDDDSGDEHVVPEPGPWSETKVIDDLASLNNPSSNSFSSASNSAAPLALSVVALVIAIGASLKARKVS